VIGETWALGSVRWLIDFESFSPYIASFFFSLIYNFWCPSNLVQVRVCLLKHKKLLVLVLNSFLGLSFVQVNVGLYIDLPHFLISTLHSWSVFSCILSQGVFFFPFFWLINEFMICVLLQNKAALTFKIIRRKVFGWIICTCNYNDVVIF
jgi:uncharacterized membrane protein (UPF0182 family)